MNSQSRMFAAVHGGRKSPLLFQSLAPALLALLFASGATAGGLELKPVDKGKDLPMESVPVGVGRVLKVWQTGEKKPPLVFKAERPITVPASGNLFVKVVYLDLGYGKLELSLSGKEGKWIKPDRFLGLAKMDTGKYGIAYARFTGLPPGLTGQGELSLRISLQGDHEHPGVPLSIVSAATQETPFDDAKFAFVVSDPWKGPYTGPSVKAPDNTTLKGKVMTGYQGWFRTPNDPEGRGWVHWGDMSKGYFNTDMWPDVSQYPAAVLEKAADVKTLSGKPGYLFSSAWPATVYTHFRWMREYDIDGAFLQRFVNDRFGFNGGQEWVLANTRAAANREGRIWAIEYDVSGYPDDRLLATLKADWMWLVDTFCLLKDPNYAREHGKPVVFIWGMPFPDRKISSETANAVVDFFKNDPKYGGNYVIGGIPGNWRKSGEDWLAHYRKYDCVGCWMSQAYAEDLADFKQMGVSYYSHVKPGFSWANLKHLPTGGTDAFTPREGGNYYWNQLSKAAKAGSDRLFVGMFDEYDESTAVMPMSDDTPRTPSVPGVAIAYFNGPRPTERGRIASLPRAELTLTGTAPVQGIQGEDFCFRMSGVIAPTKPGAYTFSIEGIAGDDVSLTVKGQKLVNQKNLSGTVTAKAPVDAAAGEALPYLIEYRHGGSGTGTVRLLWESPGLERQPVPAEALRDAWGRFLTNDGKPSMWWLQLTRLGKQMMLGKLPADSPMP